MWSPETTTKTGRIPKSQMSKKISKLLNEMKTMVGVFHWLPRIICILAILFVSMFAADAFEPGLTIWQQLGAFVMHLIPSFILISFLVLAWKWELVGGIVFMVIGLGLSPFVYNLNYNRNHSVGTSLGIIAMITFPFIVVGILFLVSHFLKKRSGGYGVAHGLHG